MSDIIPIFGTNNQDRTGDVVFVHGLNGDARETWQPKGQPNRFWPVWLGEDIPQIGVWSIGYPVSSFGWKGSTMALADRAINALVSLKTRGLGTDRPILFITHSLGGLLVKEMLRKGSDGSVPEGQHLAQNTVGVVFLSTPHSGSRLANFVSYLKFLLPTVSVKELETQEPRLRELNTWYRNNVAKFNIRTLVYCERKPTPAGQNLFGRAVSIVVVDANSADPGILNVTAVPMDEDHITISQPERSSDLYLGIQQFIRDCFLERPESSSATDQHKSNISESPKSTPMDLPTLIKMLNSILPPQLTQLMILLEMPANLKPGSNSVHGERVNALIDWANSATGPGLTKVQEELEKLLNP